MLANLQVLTQRLKVLVKKLKPLSILLLGPLFIFLGVLCFNPKASAWLGLIETELAIEIDGVHYGILENKTSLENLLRTAKNSENTRISLLRDFITEPSIYTLANEKAKNNKSLKNVILTLQSKQGTPLTQYKLKNCKPLSWTVGANPSEGGFHEQIDLAVQGVSIY